MSLGMLDLDYSKQKSEKGRTVRQNASFKNLQAWTVERILDRVSGKMGANEIILGRVITIVMEAENAIDTSQHYLLCPGLLNTGYVDLESVWLKLLEDPSPGTFHAKAFTREFPTGEDYKGKLMFLIDIFHYATVRAFRAWKSAGNMFETEEISVSVRKAADMLTLSQRSRLCSRLRSCEFGTYPDIRYIFNKPSKLQRVDQSADALKAKGEGDGMEVDATDGVLTNHSQPPQALKTGANEHKENAEVQKGSISNPKNRGK